ncbi:MAG TPA: 1-(5-phosphoribosyl)-5-[(5-phosphoribosylamino)methylideneamino]imidazole-4-carboxamide isomerase [Candidatus Omnitrophota bacterium]|nr:1-(5-phosphoribosyl)-5-[(5-phosphoribosylamino)methylideneamino]imidazole-4-carboxamide isomerase [Candidatus Omnitrophota bacterium]
MNVIPAIDIKDGKVVRLAQGKFNKVTIYSDDPLSVAHKWKGMGAQWLHVVDLDGAQLGQLKNFDTIANIIESVQIPIQIGGGVRSQDDIARLIDAGASRVILGTKVLEDPDFIRMEIQKWGDRIAVSLDCSDGKVAKRAWTSTSDVKATDLVKTLEGIGLFCIIYTDISRDGMLSGPNIPAIKEMCEATRIPIIASGGVASLNDIEKLLELSPAGLIGCICGKALYEGTLDLQEAIKLCSLNE